MKLLTSGVKDMVSTIWNKPINICNYFFHLTTFLLLHWHNLTNIVPSQFGTHLTNNLQKQNGSNMQQHKPCKILKPLSIWKSKAKREQTKCFSECQGQRKTIARIVTISLLERFTKPFWFLQCISFLHPLVSYTHTWSKLENGKIFIRVTKNLLILPLLCNYCHLTLEGHCCKNAQNHNQCQTLSAKVLALPW